MDDLNSLCVKLIKTYNTTIIDQMHPDLQNALYSNASYCSVNSYRQNEKERTVLNELIKNHITKNVEKEELSQNYIGGPITLTGHWSDTYQKLIYIFGENHSDDTDCVKFPKNNGRNEEQSGMRIETYLKKLTEINDIFLDIFIEVPAYKQKTLKYSKPLSENKFANSRLTKIGTEFAACMDGTDRNIKNCSRSRIHYIDIRTIEEGSDDSLDPISNFIQLVLDILSIHNNVTANEMKNSLLYLARTDFGQYIMNNFSLGKDNAKCLEFWNSMISNNYYVQKELDHCDKEIAETISNFIKKEIQVALDAKMDIDQNESNLNNIQTLSKFLNTTNVDTELGDDQIIYYFHSLIMFAIEINFVIVDCYILCRIFKKFNLQPDNQQKIRSTDEPESPSNIIIYAGDDHCVTYRKFLKEIGFTLIADIGSRNTGFSVKNCIDMTMGDSNGWSLQPLFSAWPPPTQPFLLLQQATQFSGFFGGFGTPTPEKAKSKKEEEEAQRLEYERKLYDENTDTGNVGKAPKKGDFKQKGRKNNPYR